MALATTAMAKQCSVLPSSITLTGQPLIGFAEGRASIRIALPNQNQDYPAVYCGRGDKRTAKGKRFKHSFGNARPRDKKKGRGLPVTPLPPRPPRKDPFDDGERIEIEIDEPLFAN